LSQKHALSFLAIAICVVAGLSACAGHGAIGISCHVDKEAIQVGIGSDGSLAWNGIPLKHSEFVDCLEFAGRLDPQPEFHIMPVKEARYEDVAWVLSQMQRLGLNKMGFVGNGEYFFR
jgi:biopolymer transport protein ExbD